MLSDYSIFTVETTVVCGTSCALRDELIGSQHPTEDYGSSVHMDSDYAFDASLDDSIEPNTRQVLKELLNAYPNSQLFVFNP